MPKLDDNALDTLFRNAHTFNKFTEEAVTDADLHAIYDLMKMGPTAANTCPARFVCVRSAEAKEKLRPAVSPGNLAKTMAAPATIIVAADFEFYEKLSILYPQTDARSWFAGNEAAIEGTAIQSGALQAAYFIMAARALGFDVGPMGGFDKAAVNDIFFAGTAWKATMLINIGHGAKEDGHYPRNPRLPFGDAFRVL